MLVLTVLALFASLAANVQADYSPSKCDESNFLTMITGSASWPSRAEAGVAYMSQPFSWQPIGSSTNVTWPAGTISIFGGKSAFNDVWISSDNAESWTLLSGTSNYVDGAYTSRKLADGSRTAACQRYGSDEVWLVAGTWSSTKTSRVQRGNLKEWTQVTTAAAFPGRERSQCLVDNNNNVYAFGGNAQSSGYSVNDIWSSTNGLAWSRITASAAWGIREGQGMGIIQTADRLMSTTGEVMIMVGGLMYNADNDKRMNDVWASRDRARTWQRLTANAPFMVRQDHNLAVSDAGILVVSAGDCGSECNLNDIWASLDGGHTWGQCCNHCGYNNREDQVTTFDRQGRLVLMGGAQTWPAFGDASDVWRSSVSFNDPQAVAAACNLQVPTCGVGFKCAPGQYCPCSPQGAGVVMQPISRGPWRDGRNEAGLALRPRPLTFVDGVTRQTRTFDQALIFYGGKYSSTYYNDVWASGDHGVTWSLISGIYNGSTAGNGNYYQDNSRAADCEDGNGRMYSIGGTNATTATFSSSVWASDDGIDWFLMTMNAPFQPREASMCVADHLNNVYVFGGSHKVYSRQNDVWKSTNGGRDWTLQTAKAPWMARTQHDATAAYSSALGKTILYVANGIYTSHWASNRNNDIWASSDEGASWIRITDHAPYAGRQDSETDSLNGVLVVTGGDIGTDNPGNVNDLWASLDGGYTWGMCNATAGYTPREDQASAFTIDGRLVLAGGDQPWVTKETVVWRSEGSFSDPAYVSANCHIPIPSCGVGLRCWPSPTQRCSKNCPAPAIPSSSSSSSSSSSTGGIVPSSSSTAGPIPSSTAGPIIPSSTSAPVIPSSSSSTGSVVADLGCGALSVIPAGTVVTSLDLDTTTTTLNQRYGRNTGALLVSAIQETVSSSVNAPVSMFQCASIADMSASSSKATVYVLGSSSTSASAVLAALANNAAGLNSRIQSKLSASASNLVAPAPLEVVKTESSSNKTSVGLTVGLCFLGLGIGLLIALFVAYFSTRHTVSNKPMQLPEESVNRGGEMEMSTNHV